MKTLYLDCSSGISGNMMLGALLELGVEQDYLIRELEKLNLSGWSLHVSKRKKHGITGTYVDVRLEESNDLKGIHHHRTYEDIIKIIDESDITKSAKVLANQIFYRVAKAEAKVHDQPVKEVHFHEVGALDSIIDIVGTAIGIDVLRFDKIYASPLRDGTGYTKCQHGQIPIPAPAVLEICAEQNIPIKQTEMEKELVTPTGAAIVAELAEEFIPIPLMTVERVGYGAGFWELPIPNLLRAVSGRSEETKEAGEDVLVMETNIDDCSPEITAYAMEQILKAGAYEVYGIPVTMKKFRQGIKITVLCKETLQSTIEKILFTETTTIGIRYRMEKRTVLKREIKEKETKYGKVKVKEVKTPDGIREYVEFESAKEAAFNYNVPIRMIYEDLMA